MAEEIGSAVYRLMLDKSGFSSGMKEAAGEAEESSSRMGKAFEGVKDILTGLAVTGLGIQGFKDLTSVIDQATDASKEAQSVHAQTAATLKSTGDASGYTADQIEKMTDAVSAHVPVNQEQLEGATNLLLTYTNIGHNVLPQTTQAVANMSIAMTAAGRSMSMGSIAQQLGRALQDPAKGMSALSREGIVFSTQQADVIKKMEASGNLAGAQQLILDQLAQKYGEAGTAAGKTYAGQLQIMNNEMYQAKVAIGDALIPALTAVETAVVPLIVDLAQHLPGAVDALDAKLSGPLTVALRVAHDAAVTFGEAISGNWVNAPGIGRVADDVGKFALALRTAGPPALEMAKDMTVFAGAVGSKLLSDGATALGLIAQAVRYLSGPLATLAKDAGIMQGAIGGVSQSNQLVTLVTRLIEVFALYQAASTGLNIALAPIRLTQQAVESVTGAWQKVTSVIGGAKQAQEAACAEAAECQEAQSSRLDTLAAKWQTIISKLDQVKSKLTGVAEAEGESAGKGVASAGAQQLGLPGFGSEALTGAESAGKSAASGIASSLAGKLPAAIAGAGIAEALTGALGPIMATAGSVAGMALDAALALGATIGIPLAIAAVVVGAALLIYHFRQPIEQFFTSTLPAFFTQTIPDAFGAITDWIKNNWGTLLIAAVTGPVGLLIEHFQQPILNFIEHTLPGILARIPYWIGYYGTLAVAESILFGINVVKALIQGLVDIAKTVADAFGAAWTWLSTNLPTWPGKIIDFLNALDGLILGLFTDAGKAAITGLTVGWTWLSTNVPTWPGKIKDFLTSLPGLLLSLATDSAHALITGITVGWTWASTTIPTWPGKIAGFLASLPGLVGTAASDAATAIKNGIEGAYTWASQHLITWGKDFKGWLTDLPKDLGDLASAAKDAFVGPFQEMESLIADAVNAVIDVINGFLSGVDAALKKVGVSWQIGLINPVGVPSTSGNAAVGASGKAAGDVLMGPQLFVAGEDAPAYPEFIIPTNPAYRGRAQGLFGALGQALGMPGFAGGGIVSGITGAVGSAASAVGNVVGSAASAVGSAALHLLSAADIPALDLSKVVSNVPLINELAIGLGAKLLDAIKSLATKALSLLTGGAGGGGGAPVNLPGSVTDWLTQAIQATGVGLSWLPGLAIIAQNESGGNPSAVNNWDINAQEGHPSQGLMQVIPGTFAAYGPAGGNILNPVDNAIAAINYIKATYGDISNVPGVRNVDSGGSYVGYATGGIVTKPTLALVGEAGPEAIIPLAAGGTVAGKAVPVTPAPATSASSAADLVASLSATANDLVTIATKLVDAFGSVTTKFKGDVLTAAKNAASAVSGIIQPFTDTLKFLEELPAFYAAHDPTSLPAGLQTKLGTVMVQLVDVFRFISDHFKSDVFTAAQSDAQAVSAVIQPFSDMLGFLGQLPAFLAAHDPTSIPAGLQTRMGTVMVQLVDVFRYIANRFSSDVLTAVQSAASAVDSVFQPFEDAMTFLGQIPTFIKAEIPTNLPGELDLDLESLMEDLIYTFTNITTNFKTSVLTAVQNAASAVSSVFQPFNDALSFLSALPAFVQAKTPTSIPAGLAKALGAVTTQLVQVFQTVAASFKGDVLSSVQSAASSVDAVFTPFNDAMTFLGNMQTFIASKASPIVGKQLQADLVGLATSLTTAFATAAQQIGGPALQAAANFAAAVGPVFNAVSSVATDMGALAGIVSVTQQNAQIFEQDVLTVLTMIHDLVGHAKSGLADAQLFQLLMTTIASTLQAATQVFGTATPSGSGGGGTSASPTTTGLGIPTGVTGNYYAAAPDWTLKTGAATAMAMGGVISEPITGYGLRTGARYRFGENGPEVVSPLSGPGAGAATGGQRFYGPVNHYYYGQENEGWDALLRRAAVSAALPIG